MLFCEVIDLWMPITNWPKAMTGWRKGLAIVLCIASVLAPFVGQDLMQELAIRSWGGGQELLDLGRYSWVYALMALIPAVTGAFAMLLRRKGYQTRRTMNIGFYALVGMLAGYLLFLL